MILENLKYTKDHEWARVAGNTASIGITHHAQDALGDVVFVELPKVGTKLEAQKTFGVVESIKAVSDLFSPISGTVLEVNAAAVNDPVLVNKDPYGLGWMIKIEMSNPSELDSLLNAADYKKLVDATH